jgi:hypothetical protein
MEFDAKRIFNIDQELMMNFGIEALVFLMKLRELEWFQIQSWDE